MVFWNFLRNFSDSTASGNSTLTQPTWLSRLWELPKAQQRAYIENIVAILSQLQLQLGAYLIRNYVNFWQEIDKWWLHYEEFTCDDT